MHLIAYNLIGLLIVQAQPRREAGSVGRLSFKGTLDRVNQWQATLWSAGSGKRSRQSYDQLLDDIARDIVRPRPGRYEPRVLKRRRDSYSLLTKPRHGNAIAARTPQTSLQRRLGAYVSAIRVRLRLLTQTQPNQMKRAMKPFKLIIPALALACAVFLVWWMNRSGNHAPF